MGLITSSVGRLLTVQNARTISPRREREMAAIVSYNQRRVMTKSNPGMYRNWSIHAPLVRAAMDIRLGQLALADWDIVPFDRDGPKPDVGLVRRQRELFQQPNASGESFGSFAWAVGDDILALDAGAIEKERMLKGEIAYLWPTDGGRIAVDRYWDGTPKSPRYYWIPQPNTEVPMLNSDLIYLMIHKRTYEPVGISYLEILRQTIESELAGSLFNARQISQAAPDGIMDLGENARPEQIASFKSFFASELAGKGSIGFWGGTKSAKFIPFRGSNKDGQFIEFLQWEASKIAIVLQLSPQDLGLLHDVNRANGEVQQENSEDRGAKTFLGNFEQYLTSEVCWDPAWGGRRNNTAFRFRAVSDKASLQKAQELKIALAGMPYESINGARISVGLPPLGDINDDTNPFNKLMANTPLGLATIDLVPNAREILDTKTKPAPDDGGGTTPAKKPATKAYEVATLLSEEDQTEAMHQYRLLSAKLDRMMAQPESLPSASALAGIFGAIAKEGDERHQQSETRLLDLQAANDERLDRVVDKFSSDLASVVERPVDVHVEAPVTIEKGAVQVHVPEPPAPVIHLQKERKPKVRKTVNRDPVTHEITSVVEEQVE